MPLQDERVGSEEGSWEGVRVLARYASYGLRTSSAEETIEGLQQVLRAAHLSRPMGGLMPKPECSRLPVQCLLAK